MQEVTITLSNYEISCLRRGNVDPWLTQKIVNKLKPDTRTIAYMDVDESVIGKKLVAYRPAEHTGCLVEKVNPIFIIRAITLVGPGSIYISDLDPYNCNSKIPNTVRIFASGGFIEVELD